MIGLVLASAIMVFAFSSMSSPLTPTRPPVTVPPPSNPSWGWLKVSVSVMSTAPVPFYQYNETVLLTANNSSGVFIPANSSIGTKVFSSSLPDVNFTIKAVGSSRFPLKMLLSQPGEDEVLVPEGFYGVSTRNAYYNLSTNAQVYGGKLTVVNVTVTQAGLVTIFSHLSNPDGSPLIAANQPLTVEVQSTSMPPPPGSFVFLRYGVGFAPGCADICTVYDSGTVRSRVLVTDPRADSLWLVLAPLSPLPAWGLGQLSVFSLQASASVAYNDT